VSRKVVVRALLFPPDRRCRGCQNRLNEKGWRTYFVRECLMCTRFAYREDKYAKKETTMPGRRIKRPVKSQKQRSLFAYVYHARTKHNMMPQELIGMTTSEIKAHLDQSKGKRLPKRARRKR
jgi:hypothetical protein